MDSSSAACSSSNWPASTKTQPAECEVLQTRCRHFQAADAGLAQISATGEPQQLLMDRDGSVVSSIASVVQRGSRLYMGTLSENYVSYIDLPEISQE